MAEKKEIKNDNHSPPQWEVLEWQSFFSSILAVLIPLIGLGLTLFTIVRKYKMGRKLLNALETLFKEEKQKARQLDDLTLRQLSSLATEIRVETGSDRVILLEKHNGEQYRSGRSRYRYSVTIDDPKDRSIAVIRPNYQDIPDSQIEDNLGFDNYESNRFVLSDLRNEELLVDDCEVKPLTESWRNWLLNLGIAYSYDIALFVNHILVGVLSIHYRENGRDRLKPLRENKQQLKRLISRVEATLSRR